MDRLVHCQGALTGQIKCEGLGIAQVAFNVPQAIVATKALVGDLTGVRQCARLGAG